MRFVQSKWNCVVPLFTLSLSVITAFSPTSIWHKSVWNRFIILDTRPICQGLVKVYISLTQTYGFHEWRFITQTLLNWFQKSLKLTSEQAKQHLTVAICPVALEYVINMGKEHFKALAFHGLIYYEKIVINDNN